MANFHFHFVSLRMHTVYDIKLSSVPLCLSGLGTGIGNPPKWISYGHITTRANEFILLPTVHPTWRYFPAQVGGTEGQI